MYNLCLLSKFIAHFTHVAVLVSLSLAVHDQTQPKCFDSAEDEIHSSDLLQQVSVCKIRTRLCQEYKTNVFNYLFFIYYLILKPKI